MFRLEHAKEECYVSNKLTLLVEGLRDHGPDEVDGEFEGDDELILASSLSSQLPYNLAKGRYNRYRAHSCSCRHEARSGRW